MWGGGAVDTEEDDGDEDEDEEAPGCSCETHSSRTWTCGSGGDGLGRGSRSDGGACARVCASVSRHRCRLIWTSVGIMIRKEEGAGGGGGAAVTHRHLRQRPACEEEEPLGCRRSQLSVEEEKAGGEGAVKGRSCGDSCSDETQNFSADADSAAEDAAGAAEAAEAAEASSASHQMQVIRPHCSNSDTCSPTPSCRICFQGAEQVRVRTHLKVAPSIHLVTDERPPLVPPD